MKLIKTYTLISNEENEDYIVKQFETEKGDLFELYFGTSSAWTSPRELVCTLLDTGNGVSIEFFSGNGKLKKLDYSDAEHIRILLTFSNRNSSKPSKYTVLTRRFTI